MKSLFIYTIISFFLLTCCKNEQEKEKSTLSNEIPNDSSLKKEISAGKILFKKYCTDCHSPPIKEVTPDLRSLLGSLPEDSINSIVDYTYDSKNSHRMGGNILIEYINDSSLVNFIHSFKDSISKEDIRKIVVYSWISSRNRRQ